MKKKVMKFGIVLVVLAIVTNAAFATNVYEGTGGTWFDSDSWSDGEISNMLDVSLGVAQIEGHSVIIDQTDTLESLDMRDGALQVGTLISHGDAAGVRVSLTTNTLKSTADATGNNFTLNISDNALYYQNDELRIGSDATSTTDATINVSGNGRRDGRGEDIEFRNDGKRLDVSVADSGYFEVTNLRPDESNGAEGEVNLDVDGAGSSAAVTGDLFMNSGTIFITNGVLDLNRLRLGADGDAYMTAATCDRAISVDEYIQMGTALGNDSQLTIDDMRLDVSDYVSFSTTDETKQFIDILGDGELVIADVDAQADWVIYITR